jgi:hypothetical protein
MKFAKLAFIGLLASASAVQAASSGTLLIQGVVNAVNDIVITPNANATTLNITGGETNKLVATVSETSNNLAGYKIQMSSANASKLVHTVDNTKQTGYTVSYNGGAAVTLTTTPQMVKNVASLTGLTTVSSNVNVNVTAYPTAVAGTYQDTITIAIVAN